MELEPHLLRFVRSDAMLRRKASAYVRRDN
jgi:hypothetical protein